MKQFTNVNDIGDLRLAVKEALEVKANRFGYKHLGENKTLLMIFFNSSLPHSPKHPEGGDESRNECKSCLMSTRVAWKLETERGVIMDGDKPEHLLEAIP